MKKFLSFIIAIFMATPSFAQLPLNGDTIFIQLNSDIILPGTPGHVGHIPARPRIVYGMLVEGVLTLDASDFQSSTLELELTDDTTEMVVLTEVAVALNGQFTFDLSALPSTIYRIQLTDDDTNYNGTIDL